ncbi:MAG: NAD-dependent epimerase/dehydratase family protein [Actinomycetia bacterium]|nr:NAD-dependent epimerase/dehydratase family protein [Actinomycetes bacterium]
MRRVLVTGAFGFIGRHVVRKLAAAGRDVIAVARPDEVVDVSLPARTVTVDISDRNELTRILKGADDVVHLAARAGGIQFQQDGSSVIFSDNRSMTDSVLESAAGAEVRRVFLASSAVMYRGRLTRPLVETDPVVQPWEHPSPHAWSKLTDEVVGGWWQQSGRLEVVAGRFSNVYDPGATFETERSAVIHALIRRAAETPAGGDLTVWGDGSAIRSFIYVDDVAAAVVAILIEGEDGSVYNVDSGIEITIEALATLVRDTVDPTLVLRFDSSKPVGMAYRVTNPGRLHSLGMRPSKPLIDEIAMTVADFRSRYPIWSPPPPIGKPIRSSRADARILTPPNPVRSVTVKPANPGLIRSAVTTRSRGTLNGSSEMSGVW